MSEEPQAEREAGTASATQQQEEWVDGHYKVTLIDAVTAHTRICQPNEDPAVRSFDQLGGALGRPYCGFYNELYEKAAVLMDSLAGSQIFMTANKRTAIALVDLLIRKSGCGLCPRDSEERITVANEELSKRVGSRQIALDDLKEWYRLRIRRFVG